MGSATAGRYLIGGPRHSVLDDDIATLSAFIRYDLRVHRDYSFRLPDLAGALREPRDPTSPD